jgi:hypothetical protein
MSTGGTSRRFFLWKLDLNMLDDYYELQTPIESPHELGQQIYYTGHISTQKLARVK